MTALLFPGTRGSSAAEDLRTEHYPGGAVHTRIEVDSQGRPNGWFREYSEDGLLKSERQFQHGTLHGVSRLYYTTGELKTEWFYEEGLRHGPSIGYFKDGQIKDKGTYLQDKLNGWVLMYYPNGKLKSKMYFEKDHPEEKGITYHKNGKVQFIYEYRKGRVRAREEYEPEGQLIRKQEYPQPPALP